MSLKVAIFEPEAEGHHMVYVEHIVRALLSRGHEVHLALTDRARAHPAFLAIPAELRDRIRLWPMPDTETDANASDLRRIRDQFKRRADYATAFAAIPVRLDCCFMLNLDRADLPLALLGSPFGKVPFSGFLMGRQFHSPKVGVKTQALRRRDKSAEPVFHRMLKIPWLKKVISVDETLVQYAQQEHLRGSEKVVHVPDATYIDPGAFRGDARAELGLAPSDIALLAYGSLSMRKGVQEAIDGVRAAGNPNLKLIIAGKQDEEVRGLLARLPAGVSIIERAGFLSAEEESMMFQACDVVWVGYRHWFGMSGVLLQAGALAKPVLAMDEGLVGFLVEKHQLGWTVDISSPQAVGGALREIVEGVEERVLRGQNGLRYAEGRTPEAFGLATAEVIESTVPLGPALAS